MTDKHFLGLDQELAIMGAIAPVHPTEQTLQAYGLGKLDETTAEPVDRHLETCSLCRQRVSELSSDSSLGGPRLVQGRPDSPVPAGSSLAGLSRSGGEAGAVAPPPASSLPPGLADHPDYEVVRELGQGGMGTVYLALNRLMGRHEVLKVVSGHLMNRRGVLDRFLGEIRSAGRLHHTNIVTAYSAMRLGESIVFAMEYVEGLDLSRLVKTKGPLSVAHACSFAHQAALGLQHAHEQGMVHRDIKPSNLMLTRQGGRAAIKVLDFGLAKVKSEGAVDGGLTHEGQMLGTPDYVAPEQTIDARKADIRADIYSLGCTLYYLLNGGPPFQATSLYEILQAHHSMDAKPLNFVRADVPIELAALVAKMMAKEPEQRFHTPAEVAQALRPFFKKGSVGIEGSNPEISQAGQPEAAGASSPAPAAAPSVDIPRPDSSWENLIAFEEAEPLMDAGGSSVGSSRTPRWIWPTVATGVMLCGVITALATGIFASKTGDAGAVNRQTRIDPGPESKPLAANKLTAIESPKWMEDTKPAARSDTSLAVKAWPERNPPAGIQRKAVVVARNAPKRTEPAPVPVEPRAEVGVKDISERSTTDGGQAQDISDTKRAVDSTPEGLLESRGLKKDKLNLSLAVAEDEISRRLDKIRPIHDSMERSWNQFAVILQAEDEFRALDTKKILTEKWISDLGAELGATPNTAQFKFRRQELIDQQAAEKVFLSEVNARLAFARKELVPPPRKQAVHNEFMKWRAQFLEAEKELEIIVDKADKEYKQLKADPAVKEAMQAVSKKSKASITLGPSKDLVKALGDVRKTAAMVADPNEARPSSNTKAKPKSKSKS